MNAALVAIINACLTVVLGKDHNSLRRLALIIAAITAALIVLGMLIGCTVALDVDGQARKLSWSTALNFWPNNGVHPATRPAETSNETTPRPQAPIAQP